MKAYARLPKQFLLGCVLGLLLPALQPVAWGQDAASAIRQVLADQETAWNKADIDGFMRGYKNSPDTTFIGKTVRHGWQQGLERYKQSYPTKEAMGTLDFSDIDVRMLGADHATATGKYHLARSAAGGGDAGGVFSLVFEKSDEGWKIILDHTS